MLGLKLSYKFTQRKKNGHVVDVIQFHMLGTKVYEAVMPRDLAKEFIVSMAALEDDLDEDVVRKLMILAANYQCIRRKDRIHEIMLTVKSLGFFETMYWCTKIMDAYEEEGAWAVCRITRSFRLLHGIE